MRGFKSFTGMWPISIHLNRCFLCKKLMWPWQSIVNDDPYECPSYVHHSCHHAHIKELFPDNWEVWLYCEHESK